ncbi:hypothetical protein P171DRAFT_486945 [Karstenula rhodostoma CBS 690.94]|uniref:Uncharacterized protein n=1 Tax=Karstenula rhodostoma CBS 690.94 TaxID=1392251 RepID=A0A9P4U932_9PLEO|nr:hypothetical protein P171DRAFT_486945 [Karstenula rhodostoma CBS 690.94]
MSGNRFGAVCTLQTSIYAQLFLGSVTDVRWSASTPAQGYLVNPGSPASPYINQDVETLDKAVFALRLGQMLNAFLSLCAGAYAVPNGLEGDIASKEQGILQFQANTSSTTAHVATSRAIITCHKGWLVALLIASLVLLVANVASITLQAHRVMPELALNCSALLRDSAYVATGTRGTHLDSYERSRLMKDVKVKLGNAAAAEKVGILTVGEMGHVQQVRRSASRLYQ